MSDFLREFDVDQLGDWVRQNPNSAVVALFDRWVLPGADSGSYGLRLGVRKKYLNLYVKGQSVAELSLPLGRPRIDIHTKYHKGAVKGSSEAKKYSQKYMKLESEELATLKADVVDGWIRTAETYAGDEKRFVDDLVAVTPGTLDLEMALPADKVGNEKTAPRMDLVVAQRREVAFWEAKCATNTELRADDPYQEYEGKYERGPHVLWQLRRYEKWVRNGREPEVRAAYVATAGSLFNLARMFNKTGPAVGAWEEFAEAGAEAKVILPPGVVIAEYCPLKSDGKNRSESSVYAAKAKSFSLQKAGSSHETRLARHGAKVVKVAAKPLAPILPALCAGKISEREETH